MKIICHEYKSNEIFRFIRQSSEMTQKEFAKTYNKASNTIRFYEAGLRNYDTSFLLEVCNSLDININIKSKNSKFSIICNTFNSKDIIKIIRKYSNMTQKEFGNLINKSYKSIQNYEYGVREYDFQLLLSICKKLNLEVIVHN